MRTWIRRRPMGLLAPTFRPQLQPLEDRQAPALLYVAPSFAPAPGGKVTFSPGPDQTVLLTPNVNAFTTFEAAVTAANGNGDANNTIRVAPGTFAVAAPQVAITKNLTVIGSG